MTSDTRLRDEFGEFVERHRKILFKVANTYCWSADDRADLVQDMLAQLWRAYPGYERSRPFSTWMYRIALNVAISWVRGHGQRQRVTVPLDLDVHDVSATPDLAADERVRALYDVIRALDPLSRALLLLYLDEHSYKDIAGILGITETNVATKIHRLKQRIRQQIGHLA